MSVLDNKLTAFNLQCLPLALYIAETPYVCCKCETWDGVTDGFKL